MRVMYIAVMNAAAKPSSQAAYNQDAPETPNNDACAIVEPCARWYTAPRISSFEKNPEKNGMPAIANVAIHISQNVRRMYGLSPPMLRMSCASSWLRV